jgi:acyl-CoA dehydrogenase
MDFSFTEEQLAVRDMIRDFVRKECAPEYIRELDESGEFPHELWAKMADLGILGGPVPVEYGGSGLGLLEECIIVEELARGMFALGTIYELHAYCGARSIAYYGSEEQKREFLPRIAGGEIKFAFGITEPGGGTDILSSLKTRAVETGDGGYRINGQKLYTSNADQSDFILTVTRTTPISGRPSDGLTIFIVPTDAKGLEIRKLAKLGGKCLSTCEVFFDDVVVPASAMVGERDVAWGNLTKTLNHERITVAANAIGNAVAALDDGLQFAKERVAFGKPIGGFQAIAHKLVDSWVEIDMARLLMWKAIALFESGQSAFVEATAAKMVASEVAFRVASRGMDIEAGHGFMMESPMQRHFRDSRQLVLGPITNEMARNVLAVKLGLPRSY